MRILVLLFLLAPLSSLAQGVDAPVPTVLLLPAEAPEAIGLAELVEREEVAVVEWVQVDVSAMRGPHGRAAWRGAKTGALVGLGIGAAATLGALIYEANVGCEYICLWHVTAAGTIPLTLGSGAVGAGVGWAGSHLRSSTPRDDG